MNDTTPPSQEGLNSPQVASTPPPPLVLPLEHLCRLIRWDPRVAILVAMGLAMICALGLPRVRLDNSLSALFSEDDRSLKTYQESRATFGNEDFIVAILADPDGIFTPEGQESLFTLTKTLSSHPLITASRSIPKIVLGLDPDAEPAEDEVDLQDLRDTFGISPLFVEDLVSKDGTVAAVYGRLGPSTPGKTWELLQSLNTLPLPADQRLVLAGPATINSELDQGALRDARMLLPLAVLSASLLLFFARGRSGLVASFAALMATLAVMGILGWCGRTINLITVGLPPLLFIMNLAASLHFLTVPGGERHTGVASIRAVGNPVFYSFLTTGAGFMALGVSEIRPIREMGIYGAGGLLFGLPLVVLIVGGVLQIFTMERSRKSREGLRRALLGFAAFGGRNRYLVLGGALVLFLIGFQGMTRVVTATSALNYLSAESPVRAAITLAEKHLMGFSITEVVIHAPAGTFVKPEGLDQLVRLTRSFEESDPRVRVRGVGDLFSHMNMMDHSDKGVSLDHYAIPEDAAVIQDYLDSLPEVIQKQLEQVLGPEHGFTRLIVRVPALEGTTYQTLLKRWKTITDDFAATTGYSVEITGTVPMLTRMQHRLLSGLKESLLLAVAVIFLALLLVTRNLRRTTLGMIPNLLPVTMIIGCMGWTGIPLDAGTAMVASISLGVVVDDSLHLLYGITTHDGRMVETVEEVGPALFWTTFSGALGFGLLSLSTFLPLAKFGVLVAATLVVALAADLLLLPALTGGMSRNPESRVGSPKSP